MEPSTNIVKGFTPLSLFVITVVRNVKTMIKTWLCLMKAAMRKDVRMGTRRKEML
jgi:hypothetical protein